MNPAGLPVGAALPRNAGGVAQLGEHLLCKQGVVGSIPITSTPGALSQRVCTGGCENAAKSSGIALRGRLAAGACC